MLYLVVTFGWIGRCTMTDCDSVCRRGYIIGIAAIVLWMIFVAVYISHLKSKYRRMLELRAAGKSEISPMSINNYSASSSISAAISLRLLHPRSFVSTDNMPFYQVEHCIPLDKTQRDELANIITHIHTRKFKTPSFFVNVRFTDSSDHCNYVGGKEVCNMNPPLIYNPMLSDSAP